MGVETQCTCKVGVAARKYDLEDLDDRILRLHSREESLRTIRDKVNERMVTSVLKSTPETIVPDVESVYDALYTPGDLERDIVTRVTESLQRAGVDLDDLTSDFVSHVTVRKHLNECLDTETYRAPSINSDEIISTIEWARSRSQGVISETVQRGRNSGTLIIGNPDITVSVRITCTDCGETFRPRDFRAAPTCQCDFSEE